MPLQKKTTGKRVIHTTSKSWDFPYCAQCFAHVNAAAFALLFAGAIVLLSCIALFFFGPISMIAGTLLSIFTYGIFVTKAKSKCSTSCACVHTATNYLGWQSSCHKFEIKSTQYALLLMEANKNKLVNVSPEIWQMLQASSPAFQSKPLQAPRRNIS